MDEFVNLARMLRSAGGGFVWSLQRADSTQMHTIVKGQGGGKVCFGVEPAHDAKWGLTDAQEQAGARPDQWRDRQPAMAYADTRGVTPDRISMPQRWFDWGSTNNERVANFRAHCARYPAAARPVDATTAKLLNTLTDTAPLAGVAGSPPDEMKETGVVGDYLTPDPELDAQDAANPVDPDAELADVADVPLGKPAAEKLDREDALIVLERTLATFGDSRPFGPKDLYGVMASTGFGRGWLMKQLKARVDAGALERDEDAGP